MTLDYNHRPTFAERVNAAVDRALTADQATRPPRDYLGGSRLGHACERALQFGHNGADWLEMRGWIESVRHRTPPPVAMIHVAVVWVWNDQSLPASRVCCHWVPAIAMPSTAPSTRPVEIDDGTPRWSGPP